MTAKTDNHSLADKLNLRRYFLKKYHTGSIARVLDCCQGGGKVWGVLRKEFDVKYWGMDLKPKKGRLSLDSIRYLAQAGWPEDVVDIDSYGSPWKHWAAMTANIVRPISIFLTIGEWQMGTDRTILDAAGLGKIKPPQGISFKLHQFCERAILARAPVEITEALECDPGGSAKYMGLRVCPKSSCIIEV